MYYPRKNIYKYFYLIKIKITIYTKTIIISNLPDDYVENFNNMIKIELIILKILIYNFLVP